MNKVERHMDICKHLNGVYERKNHDYGDSFHDTFVEEGMAMARIRLSDKLGRFKKLSREGSEQKVNDESIRDTLLDLANYAIMTVMEMDILEEEEARVKLQTAIREHRTNSDHICPACGNKMEYHPEIGKYTCSQCGTMYAISASNGAPEIDNDPRKIFCRKTSPDQTQTANSSYLAELYNSQTDDNPCKKCTYPGKETCSGCMDLFAWKKQQRSDTDAVEAEQVDG